MQAQNGQYDTIAVYDFGTEYLAEIIRWVGSFGKVAVCVKPDFDADKLKELNPSGIIVSGSPSTAYWPDAPRLDERIYELGIPMLGICYGMQLMAQWLGGEVEKAPQSEHGAFKMRLVNDSPLFEGCKDTEITTWMKHNDWICIMPPNFDIVAETDNTPYACIQDLDRKLFGTQFHPEVGKRDSDRILMKNFITKLCKR